MIGLAIAVAAATLAVGTAATVGLRLLPTVRLQLAVPLDDDDFNTEKLWDKKP